MLFHVVEDLALLARAEDDVRGLRGHREPEEAQHASDPSGDFAVVVFEAHIKILTLKIVLKTRHPLTQVFVRLLDRAEIEACTCACTRHVIQEGGARLTRGGGR